MLNHRNRRLMRISLLAVVMLIGTAPALAQSDAPKPPFDVQGLKHNKVWVPWIFAFLFGAGCIAIAFKNPHRTHLD